ncbi:MAG: hypothetical protein ABR861_15715 [Terriglobales bacterium]|jgi:hypothetical protein
MTQALALERRSGLITPNRSTAWGESAVRLADIFEQIRMHLLASYAVRYRVERTLDELDVVRDEASVEGWDGYGAKPMNREAYLQAKRFLESLPTTAPQPEISADPDGDVALDWSFGSRKALSVSINERGRCTFACMRGYSTFRGTDWFDDGIPGSIANALSQLAHDSAATNPAR